MDAQNQTHQSSCLSRARTDHAAEPEAAPGTTMASRATPIPPLRRQDRAPGGLVHVLQPLRAGRGVLRA
jgi:hypothetical protein